MKIKTTLFVLTLVLSGVTILNAQRGFFMPPGVKTMDIPFEYNNNFIVIPMVVNGRLPMRFIFDTGAGHTLFLKKELSPILDLKYERTFQVLGSDLSKPLTAYLAKGVRFDLPEKLVAPKEDILVLDEDFFRFEEYSGVEVQGILSGNIFARYIYKINYDKGVITLYDRAFFDQKDVKGYTRFPLEVYREKPYFYTKLTMAADSTADIKLLMDTGASMPLLLFADTHPMLKPPANAIPASIGQGLGGDIEGFTGRVKALEIGDFQQQNIVTYFQVLDTIVDSLAANKRNGVVGNGLLNRYSIILDYHSEQAWLKPSKRFKEEFIFDRSGIGVILTGEFLDTYVVHHILPGSPAAEADIRKGDIILRVGRKPARWMTLTGIVHRFQGKPGKPLKIIVDRNGQKLTKEIILRDLI